MSEQEKHDLTAVQQEALLHVLQTRFEENMARHKGLAWADVQARLVAQPHKLWSLQQMEETGGEPDVAGREAETGAFIFYDCAPQSPAGRRSICYDGAARAARKKNKPHSSAMEMAAAMGISLLTEAQYRALQELGEFDTTTSSWLVTPGPIRERGGAIFGDRRYGQIFIYHNGADSYYAARGFRGALVV